MRVLAKNGLTHSNKQGLTHLTDNAMARHVQIQAAQQNRTKQNRASLRVGNKTPYFVPLKLRFIESELKSYRNEKQTL